MMKKNYLYAVVAVCIWSTLAATAKILVSDIPNLETLAVSGALAFLFLLVMNIKNGAIKQMRCYRAKDYLVMAGLGFLGMFLYSALYYYGLSQLTSQEACILNYLWPIMLVIFSVVILKEKLTLTKGLAMLCSFLGIVILSTGGSASAEGNTALGMIACVVAAASYGLYSVLNKKVNYNQNITMMVIWFVVAVCSGVLGLATEEWKPIEGGQWLGFLWLGVMTSAVAYLLWALALNGMKDTAKIANLAFLTPFLSLIVSAVLLKEQIRLRAVLALVLIVGGILLQSFCDALKARRQQKTSI